MSSDEPNIYVLHGDDDFAISQFCSSLEEALGDASLVAMNKTVLDGRTSSLDELNTIAWSLPFLAKYRLALVYRPLDLVRSQADKERLLLLLEKAPPTTRLALVHNELLTPDRERRNKKIHWLETWAVNHPQRVQIRECRKMKGRALAQWIQEQAKRRGGRFSGDAAVVLAELVGDDSRLADQEIQKLITYVGGKKIVEAEDVNLVTADTAGGDIFALVDSLAERQPRQAMRMLTRLLERQDANSIFGMIVRQFRLLVQAREIIERRGGDAQVASELAISKWEAEKIHSQAGSFSLPFLEGVYRRLLDLDREVKTGEIQVELALELLVYGFTGSRERG